MNAFTDIQIEAQVAPPERPKTPEQIAHIDAVIALIEGEETTFDMGTWLTDEHGLGLTHDAVAARTVCGTIACIGGHSDLVAGRIGVGDEELAQRFGMSSREAHCLFYDYPGYGSAITPTIAIRALKHIRAGNIFTGWKDFLEETK